MQQVWITEVGPPDVLKVRDAPDPEPRPGEVRIAVEAMGINFADIMGRLGIYQDAPRVPYVPGHEIAGEVVAVGEGVDDGYLGQDVMALVRHGGYSTQVCVPVGQTFPRPINMPAEHAAGFLVASLTAYAALVSLAGIKRGESVLIHAAAGGLGLAAVDVARIYDATIFGTASSGKHEFLRQWGVHHPLEYRRFDRHVRDLTEGRGVQIVLDTRGGRSWLKSYRSLSPMGRLIVAGALTLVPGLRRSGLAFVRFALTTPWFRFNPVTLANANKGVLGVNLAKLWDHQAMMWPWVEQLVEWYVAGQLRVHVDRVFPLAEAAAAHRYIQGRQNIGKVILVP